uniref:Regucalcin n=1 Tax=Cacopsylla melanoneura TaxID=428564 RepID=A0A8D8PX01_9HEMI
MAKGSFLPLALTHPIVLLLYPACIVHWNSSAECNPVPTLPGGPYLQQVTKPIAHGEGPFWDSEKQALYFVDIAGFTVHRYHPHTRSHTTAYIGKDVGFIFPIKGTKEEFLIGRGTDLVHLTWDGTNSTLTPEMKVLATVDQDKEPGNRFNDAKVDASGRLWAGTMGFEDPTTGVKPNQGTLYRMVQDPHLPGPCKLDPVVSPVSISNGIIWNAQNNLMYYIDTPTRKIDVFDYDIRTGSIANRRTVFDFASAFVPGSPDGMTIDSDGKLWVASWGGSRILKIDPLTSSLLASILLPVERPTSVAFGGMNYDTLYVTTMRKGLSYEQLLSQPNAGALFKITNLPNRGVYSPPVNYNCDTWVM